MTSLSKDASVVTFSWGY